MIAFDCRRGVRNGADISFVQNAMTMEQDKIYAKHLGSFEKQFEKVKNYTSKALIKLSKTKPYNSEKEFFLNLEDNIKFVESHQINEHPKFRKGKKFLKLKDKNCIRKIFSECNLMKNSKIIYLYHKSLYISFFHKLVNSKRLLRRLVQDWKFRIFNPLLFSKHRSLFTIKTSILYEY